MDRSAPWRCYAISIAGMKSITWLSKIQPNPKAPHAPTNIRTSPILSHTGFPLRPARRFTPNSFAVFSLPRRLPWNASIRPACATSLEDLIRKERFDCAVVDHLAPTGYFPDLPHAIFFQHNVETVIWRRHVEHAPDPLRRAYFRLQADRMYRYERRVSRASGHIVAVSQTDADEMRRLFDVTRVTEIPTGVNIDYFLPPAPPLPLSRISSSSAPWTGSPTWMA